MEGVWALLFGQRIGPVVENDEPRVRALNRGVVFILRALKSAIAVKAAYAHESPKKTEPSSVYWQRARIMAVELSKISSQIGTLNASVYRPNILTI